MQFLAVLTDSFRESRESRIFWIMLGASLLILLFLTSIGITEDQMRLLFGAVTIDLSSAGAAVKSNAGLADWVIYLMFEFIVGWIGIILMIIATAHVIPSLMDSGVAGILLSKPISRGRLFSYKYISAMVFVFVQATIAFTGVFLVMGLCWNEWRPGSLLAIPAVVLVFSYVFCISALVGMKTRSAVASTMIAITAWVVFSIVSTLPQVFEYEELEHFKENTLLYNSIRVISWIPPKTGDTTYLVRRWANVPEDPLARALARSGGNRNDMERAMSIDGQIMDELSVPFSIGTSLVFELLIISLCIWSFSRQDF